MSSIIPSYYEAVKFRLRGYKSPTLVKPLSLVVAEENIKSSYRGSPIRSWLLIVCEVSVVWLDGGRRGWPRAWLRLGHAPRAAGPRPARPVIGQLVSYWTLIGQLLTCPESPRGGRPLAPAGQSSCEAELKQRRGQYEDDMGGDNQEGREDVSQSEVQDKARGIFCKTSNSNAFAPQVKTQEAH